ncbi:MAG TPA: polyprenyl synthetase family protein [Polyangia bacterium]|jgi:geranylgeranyl diphosphate synthase type II
MTAASTDQLSPGSQFDVARYLAEARRLTLDEIGRYLPAERRHTGGLYDLMMDYPLRPAKALRPALCIASSLAVGGHLDGVLPSAAALELFHNAFLLHDDVEDGSEKRRHEPTLHKLHGVPMAVNVGDGMLALALDPLLDNVGALGLGAALRILRVFARMARESAEGQMLELHWIRARKWDVRDAEYLRMVHKKTGWYSFITPTLVGAIAGSAGGALREALARFALLLGIAFQIQDDVLSIAGAEADVGKDALGDLWEGKYTLILLHALRTVPPAERDEALRILALERGPRAADDGAEGRPAKQEADVQWLAALVRGRDGQSLRYALRIAVEHARRARHLLDTRLESLPGSVHKQFLAALVDYVIERAN